MRLAGLLRENFQRLFQRQCFRLVAIRQRGVDRRSRYADFSPRKRERFLQALAFSLLSSGRRGSFTRGELYRAYETLAMSFGLPQSEARTVTRELEAHTGLIQPAGFGGFEFNHLVIHEYLAAMHAGRLPRPGRELIPDYPNEMALVVAASSAPEDSMEDTLTALLSIGMADRRARFVEAFLARVATERPTLRASARLGWTVIGLLSLITPGPVRRSDPYPAHVQPLMADPVVRESIRLAAAQATLSRSEGAIRFIPGRTDMSPDIAALLDRRGITLRLRPKGSSLERRRLT